MTTERLKRIHQILGIAAALSLILAGLLLMSGCYGIYVSGDHPFSREAVAAAFSPISLPIYLCVAVVAADVFVSLLLPGTAEKCKPEKQLPLILRRLHAKTDLSKCSSELQSQIEAQQRSRKLHKTIRSILTALCAVIFLCYGLNSANFHQSEINASMIRAMYLLVPCSLIPFGYGVFTSYWVKRSMQREIDLLRSAPKDALHTPDPLSQTPDHRKQAQAIRWTLLGIGLFILIFGFVNGGTADVLTKAINICTECVGLG